MRLRVTIWICRDTHDTTALVEAQDVTCTYTDTRGAASSCARSGSARPAARLLTWAPTAARHDVDEALALTANGTTGPDPVDTGARTLVFEVLTNASNYDTTLARLNDNGTGTGGVATTHPERHRAEHHPGRQRQRRGGTAPSVVCTYTDAVTGAASSCARSGSARPAASIFLIGTTAGDNDVDEALALTLTSTDNRPQPGRYRRTYFRQRSIQRSNYDTTLACFNDNGTGTGGRQRRHPERHRAEHHPGRQRQRRGAVPGAVVVSPTPTPVRGSIELRKVWVARPAASYPDWHHRRRQRRRRGARPDG